MTVFVSLGAKPEEPSHLRGRNCYPAECGRVKQMQRDSRALPEARSALMPLLHLVHGRRRLSHT